MGFKKILKKTWHFIWKDDSIWSWIVNIIIAFILVKFVVYPGLGALLDTGYPVVAVVSKSMEHNSKFDEWWNRAGSWYTNEGISETMFRDYTFKNGFNMGDVMVLRGEDIEDIKLGDVIVFRSVTANPIIHRVVKVYEDNGEIFLQTKGDNNGGVSHDLGEDKIGEDRLIGRAFFRIPLVGWIKIIFSDLIGGM